MIGDVPQARVTGDVPQPQATATGAVPQAMYTVCSIYYIADIFIGNIG